MRRNEKRQDEDLIFVDLDTEDEAEDVNEESENESEDDENEPENDGNEPEKPKRNWKKILGITTGSILGVLLIVYLGMAVFFQSHYYFFTEINGTDFSGKTVKAVEEYMEEQVGGYKLQLKTLDGKDEQILGTAIGLEYQPGNELKQYLEKQNAFLWPQAFWKRDKVQASIGVKYNETALKEQINSLNLMNPDNQTPPESAVPVFNGTEYEIQPEVLGTQVDEEVFQKKAAKAISEFNDKLDMEKEGCYVQPDFTSDAEEVKAAQEKMNRYVKASITYNLNPEKEVVDKELISEWLSVNDKMKVIVKKKKVQAYVKELAEKYDTVGTTRKIQTPSGKTANVSGGSYGWKLNQEAEADELISNIKKGEELTREPIFSQKAIYHGANDWGNTFVEVDLSAQHMWYISEGKVVFQSQVVTGKPDGSHNTPAGIFSILEKMRDKTLRGNIMPDGKPEYETPVAYWMRVTWSGVGFHDATWQAAFGGTRYKDGYGSHGCINMPYGNAASLYSMVYVGVPVIIHY